MSARVFACQRVAFVAAFLIAVTALLHPAAAIAQTQTAVEYYYADWNFYFVTSDPGEIAALDAGAFGGLWKRTGEMFTVWTGPTNGALPACRFFFIVAPRSSHFYTPIASECASLKAAGAWQYEGIAFYVLLPDANGNCPPGTTILYRLYNNGMGGAPNHRFTIRVATFNEMRALGWLFEGDGRTGAYACVPAGGVTATAQLVVTSPPTLAGQYAAVTYNQAPGNVTSTTPLPQGDFFIYDGVDCQSHTLTKPVPGSGSGKVALLTGSYPTTCTYYDDIVRELQADGVVAVVFGFSNGGWRTAMVHGNPAGLSVPVLDMQVDEVSSAIRTAVLAGTTVSASFVAVPSMSMTDVFDTFLAGQTKVYGLVPTGSVPSSGATWDFSTLDFDRTVPGIQQSYTFPSGCRASFNYDPTGHLVSATVPGDDTFTGTCTKTYLVRDTAGYQGIGLMTLYVGVPHARDDVAETLPGVPVTIDVFANDEGDSSTKVASRLDLVPSTTAIDQTVVAAEGSWSVVGSDVVFTPSAGFVGLASISYVVRGANGGSSNTAAITVTVLSP